ncbi:MAG TPA: patatin-like phospholipase family protein [Myxococcota bacterium]|jgi:NTE family protein|nr:patatin-like phospholipase family protein [Myxococcota bacterium]
MPDGLKTALVLAGGGARGAYEAGVIRYLREGLPEPARSRVRLDILCGVSVGAINACFLAATAHRPRAQGRLLMHYWRALRAAEVYDFGWGDLFRVRRWLLGASLDPEQPVPPRRAGLLNTEPIERLVRHRVPWHRIAANLASGALAALAVSATDIATGRTFVFVQTGDGAIPNWGRDPRRLAVGVTMAASHALASAAIPLMFPPVEIDGRFFCDGGLRQNTPVSPALRLGADRMLVVALRHEPRPRELSDLQRSRLRAYPGAVFLLGKVFNALLLDHLDYDLEQMRLINEMVDGGERAYGRDFLAQLNGVVAPLRGVGYRKVRTLVLRPSRDIGAIAARHISGLNFGGPWRRLLKMGLRLAARGEEREEADLLSYLLFDGPYVTELAELGYLDAAARRDELVDFFGG